MTGLDYAQILKDEMAQLTEEISARTRRRAILQHAATKLRLGYAPQAVLAEIVAAGEAVPLAASGEDQA